VKKHYEMRFELYEPLFSAEILNWNYSIFKVVEKTEHSTIGASKGFR
jgi:hypothetical protein